jgi:hypothetical protein
MKRKISKWLKPFIILHIKTDFRFEFNGGHMKKVVSVAILVGILGILTLLHAEIPSYVGAKKCKGCHSGAKKMLVYEKWEKAVHARAFETLKAKGEEKNPLCLDCHVTGFNDGGYQLNASNASEFEGIQCEACHGKGSLYMKANHMKDSSEAVLKGLLIPVEVVCTKCHNKRSPNFKGFNYQESLKRINHRYRTHY